GMAGSEDDRRRGACGQGSLRHPCGNVRRRGRMVHPPSRPGRRGQVPFTLPVRSDKRTQSTDCAEGFWILEFGFWIEEERPLVLRYGGRKPTSKDVFVFNSKIQNPKSKIPLRICGLAFSSHLFCLAPENN